MTASDPSMWDQQPHHECSANNNGNESPDYACRLLAPNRPTGEATWRPIEGTITTTETSTPYDLVRIVTYLTDDAEEAQGH